MAEEQVERLVERGAREAAEASAKTFAQKLKETSQQLGSF